MNIQNLKCLLETAESSSVTAMAGRCILEQFLFIEILCVVQSLLCHVAKHTVGFSLQTGLVIERRRLFYFLLTLAFLDDCHRTTLSDSFRRCLSFEAFSYSPKTRFRLGFGSRQDLDLLTKWRANPFCGKIVIGGMQHDGMPI